jgi:hypothetical protein
VQHTKAALDRRLRTLREAQARVDQIDYEVAGDASLSEAFVKAIRNECMVTWMAAEFRMRRLLERWSVQDEAPQ